MGQLRRHWSRDGLQPTRRRCRQAESHADRVALSALVVEEATPNVPDVHNRHVTLRQRTKRLVPRPVRVLIRSSFSYWRSIGRPALFATARPALLNTARWVTRPIATDTSLDPYHRVVERFFAEASKRSRYRALNLGSYGVPVDARLKGWSEYVGVDIRPDPEHVHLTSFHSPLTFSIPPSRNCRKPSSC